MLQIRVRATEVPPPSAGAKAVGHDPTVGQIAAQLSDERRTRRLTEGMVALEVPLALVVGDKRHGVQASPVHATFYPQRLSEWFGQHRKAAGIPVGTLHTLRHTAATLALTSGVPVHIVAARLGDNPTTVLSTYAHLLPQSDELAAERVAALITTTGGT